jgi:hypothetical protein
MAYSQDDHFIFNSCNDDHGMAAAIELEAAAGAILTKSFEQPRLVTRFGYRVTELFQYHTKTTEGVLTIYKYPGGVSANKVALGTITLKDGDAVGDCPFVDLDNQPVAAVSPYTGLAPYGVCDIEAGDQVVIEITTQGVGDSYILGEFQPFFCAPPRAEEAGNQPRMIDRTPTKTAVTSNIAAAEATENP